MMPMRLINPLSEERTTISKLMEIAKPLMDTIGKKDIPIGHVISMMRGEMEAPKVVVKFADYILALTSEPAMAGGVVHLLRGFIQTRDLTEQQVLDVFKSIAPLVNAPVVESFDEIPNVMKVISERIAGAGSRFSVNGIVRCPYCSETHLV